MRERGREMVNWMVEELTKSNRRRVSDGVWEVINGVLESLTKREVGEKGGSRWEN